VVTSGSHAAVEVTSWQLSMQRWRAAALWKGREEERREKDSA